jgi:Zn-dependent protease with chaperone function
LILVSTVTIWWSLWNVTLQSELSSDAGKYLENWFALPLAEFLLFFIPPMVGLGLFLILSYGIDGFVLGQKWTLIDVSRLAWWRLLSFVVPLLFVSMGTDDLLRGKLQGCVWVALSGIVAVLGMIFLRRAEGFRKREVKGSETRNRAKAIARRMGVKLERVYVVPAGRGHLTNAFAGGGSIFLTDNLGEGLDKREIDSVIAHELGHLSAGHSRKKLLRTIAIYAAMALVLFAFHRNLTKFRPLLDIAVILVPLAVFYFLSRRHEYEADRIEVKYTRDPETAIRALRRVYALSAAPTRTIWLAQIFATHPSFERRARAMGREGVLGDARITEILQSEDCE